MSVRRFSRINLFVVQNLNCSFQLTETTATDPKTSDTGILLSFLSFYHFTLHQKR